MNKTSIWSLKLNTAALVLIPAAVGINYIGKLFAGLLKLPLWLDAIGTVLAALLGGPIVGALCGAINNIIYGLTMDPVSFVYALSSIGIGLVVGVLARLNQAKNFKGIAIISLAVVLVSVVISTPINMIFWEGTTGNIWGDAVYAWCLAQGMPTLLASALDELVVDIPDKFATVFIGYAIFKGLPQKLVLMYNNDLEIEHLD
ncbi:MAG: ECF transporter S component [Cellulosilyticum sp.]|nr:ECF transporter S component [Cellulosilyticum sp.]